MQGGVMQSHSPYGIYAHTVVSDYQNGEISIELALKKILDMVITSVQPDQLQACLWAWSQIVEDTRNSDIQSSAVNIRKQLLEAGSTEVMSHGG